MKATLRFLIIVGLFMWMNIATGIVKAACSEFAECGQDSEGRRCDPPQTCFDKCCISPNDGGSACFVPGTIVATPTDKQSGGQTGGQATKKIEDIKVGDEVTSFASEGKDKIVNASVSKIFKSQRDYYYELQAGEF